MTVIESPVRAAVWAGLTEDDNYQLEGELLSVKIERSDVDEVAIHAARAAESAEVSLYLSRAEALALSHLLIVSALKEQVD